MRRRAPRPFEVALREFAEGTAPAGVLPRVQAAWPGVAGPAIAAEAEPVSERDGVVTVACRSAVWAQELELLGPDLLDRLNASLGASQGPPSVRAMRFRTQGSAGS